MRRQRWAPHPGRWAAYGRATAASGLLLLGVARAAVGQEEEGRRLYERWCLECHGAEGRGDGPAADRMLPRPRDFTAARYQVRTTGSGELPTDEDLRRVLRDGLPGTTMPGWPNLSSGEREAVIGYIKSLSRFFEGPAPEPLTFSSDPGSGGDALERGRQVYEVLECFKCHGTAGRGDGSSAPTLEDWRELPIRAADLTEPWFFNGGGGVEQIHARILTGLDGTPMPSAVEAVQAEIVTEDDIWYLAHYVNSLAPTTQPPVREVVRVRRWEAELPVEPDDPRWAEVEAVYFPLVGQVIRTPRLFAPTVDGVWVQGVHDGTELVLRLVWHDPSRSPDPAWDEWQEKVAATLYADGEPIPTAPLPDAFAVQFPLRVPEGNERPYFLMGSPRQPVGLWRWTSGVGVSEGQAAGLGSVTAVGSTGLTGAATYADGEWRLLFRRSLASEGEGPSFAEGVPIPAAFFAWDGSSGEEGRRGSISSWYYIFLEEAGSAMLFLAPLLAALFTGGLGLVAVRRARGRWEV